MLEVSCQQVVVLRHFHRNLVFAVEEGIAQLPYPQGLVGKILILNLTQSTSAEVLGDVFVFDYFSRDKVVVDVEGKREPMNLLYVVQYGEINDKQLLVEIHHLLLVYRVKIYRCAIRDDSLAFAYGLRPVYLVETAMHILHDEGKVVLVVAVEIAQGYDDIKQSSCLYLASCALALNLAGLKDVLVLVFLVNVDGAVNPYRELREEFLVLITFSLSEILFQVACFKVNDFRWLSAEDSV